MKQAYLAMTVIGGVLPYAFFINYFLNEGIDITGFITALFVNGAAGGFTVDLLITSCVFWMYLISTRAPKLWLYVLVNLTIGLSCAVPLYLYLSESATSQKRSDLDLAT
jgi:hypothetical protein